MIASWLNGAACSLTKSYASSNVHSLVSRQVIQLLESVCILRITASGGQKRCASRGSSRRLSRIGGWSQANSKISCEIRSNPSCNYPDGHFARPSGGAGQSRGSHCPKYSHAHSCGGGQLRDVNIRVQPMQLLYSLYGIISHNVSPQFLQHSPANIVNQCCVKDPVSYSLIICLFAALDCISGYRELCAALRSNSPREFHPRKQCMPRFSNPILCIFPVDARAPLYRVVCFRSDLSWTARIPVASQWNITSRIKCGKAKRTD